MAAARSFKITLRNVTPLTLNRASTHVLHGQWSNNGNDSPPQTIGPMSRGWWSSESSGFATGTEGSVTYNANGGQVLVHWNNPFVGSNGLGIGVPANYSYDQGSIDGDNVDVIITITPNV